MEQAQINATLDEIRDALEKGHLRDAMAALTKLHPADRADAFSDLPDEDRAVLLPEFDLAVSADLLEELEDDEAASLANDLPTELLADVLDQMEPDEAADVLGDLPPSRAAEALAEMEEAHEVIPLLNYPDETAGGLMTTSFIALNPNATSAQAIDYLRELEPDVETPYYMYVVDQTNHLVGILGMRDLIVARPDTVVETIMGTEVISAAPDQDQEEVARMMARYDLAAIPVVDEHKVIQGVITQDDLVEVLEEEATEDIYRLANVPDHELRFDSPVRLSVRKRLPWLYLNTLTALFAAWVISNFESLFQQVAVLAVFQSVVAGMGGNAATQSLAMIVRAIALGDVSIRDSWRSLGKQVASGVIQGVAVGLVVGVGVYFWKGNVILGLIIALALIGNIIVAAIAGTLVPLGLKALNLDPALASSVLVTAVTDSVGFAIFLGLATIFLAQLT